MRTMLSFVGVGAAGAGAYVGLSSIIHSLGLSAWIASLASYLVLIPTVYLAQRNITFESRASHLSSFPKYVTTQIVGLTLSALVPYQLEQSGGVPAPVAFALVAITIALVNFILAKYWTFATHA